MLLSTLGLFALQSALPAVSMDAQTAQQMRLARKARMKEKYGSGDLTEDEKRLLTELNETVNKLYSPNYVFANSVLSHAFAA